MRFAILIVAAVLLLQLQITTSAGHNGDGGSGGEFGDADILGAMASDFRLSLWTDRDRSMWGMIKVKVHVTADSVGAYAGCGFAVDVTCTTKACEAIPARYRAMTNYKTKSPLRETVYLPALEKLSVNASEQFTQFPVPGAVHAASVTPQRADVTLHAASVTLRPAGTMGAELDKICVGYYDVSQTYAYCVDMEVLEWCAGRKSAGCSVSGQELRSVRLGEGRSYSGRVMCRSVRFENVLDLVEQAEGGVLTWDQRKRAAFCDRIHFEPGNNTAANDSTITCRVHDQSGGPEQSMPLSEIMDSRSRERPMNGYGGRRHKKSIAQRIALFCILFVILRFVFTV